MVSKKRIWDDIYSYWNVKIEKKIFKSRISLLDKPRQEFEKNDIVAILTEWEEFITYDYSKALIFDGRNFIKTQNVKK